MRGDLPSAKYRRNMPEAIPVVIIGRLAIDRNFQNQGIGKGLLRDAIARIITASQTIGIRAILVHALHDNAATFYKKYDFIASPSNALTLLLPVETAVAALDLSPEIHPEEGRIHS